MRTAARAAAGQAARRLPPRVPTARFPRKLSQSAGARPLLSPAASCCLVPESLALPAYCVASCSNQKRPTPPPFRERTRKPERKLRLIFCLEQEISDRRRCAPSAGIGVRLGKCAATSV